MTYVTFWTSSPSVISLAVISGMASSSGATKVGHGLAKALGIKLNYREPFGKGDITRGESIFSVSTADTYVEDEPTTADWLREVTPTPQTFLRYLYDLFPFVHWITRYNARWLFGDVIAGESRCPCNRQRDVLTIHCVQV